MKYGATFYERNSIFKCKQTVNGPWGPEKYDYTMMKYGATFYSLWQETRFIKLDRDRYYKKLHKFCFLRKIILLKYKIHVQ